MALTYRSVKGSALTINELDDNFRYFTGSHAITASSGPFIISGSDGVAPAFEVTGSATFKDDVVVGDDFIVVDETTLKKEVIIGYKDFTNYDVSYQLNVTASVNSDKSARFDGGIEVTGSSLLVGLPTSDPGVAGGLWVDASADYVIKVSQ